MVDTDWYKGTKISWICRPEKIFLSKKIASAPRRAPWKAGQPSQAPPAEGRAASTSVARGRLMRGRGGSVARLVRSRGVSVARLVRDGGAPAARFHPGAAEAPVAWLRRGAELLRHGFIPGPRKQENPGPEQSPGRDSIHRLWRGGVLRRRKCIAGVSARRRFRQ